ncbi:hypothetical protein AQUCO_00300589v1 [Aquilegia coerulea]|uniref:Uncharacterized protein n=1 Tax=Aquilegia coerulea TaxID=218851 RepID=A0A2G5EZU6_AQUCA|nr:hypothetical protein AQUCO_00300589v1 [Aquilegia coerulea]
MEGSKFISNSKFCWADEVEKEEEEEAIKTHHLHQLEKLNPFGSARPRELVLEEKGVDWRKLDEKLHKPSSSPSNVVRKEKQPKETAPGTTAPVDGKHTWSPRTSGLERNIESTRLGGNGNPAGCLMFPNHDMDPLVPPLRYPPRNIMVLMKQWPSQVYNVATLLDSAVFPIERRREDSINEVGMQRSLNFKRLDTGVYRSSDLHDREIELEKEKSYMENERCFIQKELGNEASGDIGAVRSSSVQKVNSNYGGTHRLPGPIVANGRRRRAADEEFDRGNIENEYGRTDGLRKSARGLPLIRPQPNGERLGHCHLKNDEVGFNCKNVGVRPLEEHENRNMENVHSRQTLDARGFDGFHMGRVDKGRSDYENMTMKKPAFESNNKKKGGTKSRVFTSHEHQLRRK